MVIGRGRRREHPMDTSEGVRWPSVTTGVAQLPVAHAHTQGNLEGVKWPWVTSGSHVTFGHYGCCATGTHTREPRRDQMTFGSHVTTTKKKNCGKKPDILPVRASSGYVTFHFRSKGHTRADIAQLPVAHAHNLLPDRARDWHDFRSHDFRLLLIAHPQILTELYPYTTYRDYFDPKYDGLNCILIPLWRIWCMTYKYWISWGKPSYF
jgi:hypothetical protein